METWQWGIVLRPLATAMIVGMGSAISWVLYRTLPHGAFKVWLLRVRCGPDASRREKVNGTLLIVGIYVFAIAAGWYIQAHY